MMKFNFPYHLVSSSPWPIMSSMSIMFMLLGVLKIFYSNNFDLFCVSVILTMLIIFQWWRDVIRESLYQGNHSIKVAQGLQMGMILFILSELMFFVSFFWAYFHMFLSPSMEIGSQTPAFSIISFNPYNIPLLNTMILLASGVSITLCHHSIMFNNVNTINNSFIMTLTLGSIFTFFQYMEYYESFFTFTDSMYGSIFFLATGFHGIHVLIGTIFIFITFIRFKANHFSKFHHIGFELSSWYWHFVDIIWLFLFIFLYWLPK